MTFEYRFKHHITATNGKARTIAPPSFSHPLFRSHATRVKHSGYAVRNRVIDSLYLRSWTSRHPSSFLSDSLEAWRLSLEDYKDDALTVEIPLLGTFKVMRCKRPYEFMLICDTIATVKIWKPEKWNLRACAETGQFFVEFRSIFMQAGGIPACARFMADLEATMTQSANILMVNPIEPYIIVSRIDLAVDYEMPEGSIPFPQIENYVTKAPRLKREGFLSPFQEDTQTVIKTVLNDALKRWKLLKKTGVLATVPGGCNKGGLFYRIATSGGSAEPLEIPKTHFWDSEIEEERVALAATAAEFTFMSFLGYLQATWDDGELRAMEREDGRPSRVVASNLAMQTIYLGRYGSKLYAREYNKLLSVAAQNKFYMLDVWLNNGWKGVIPIWRLEFSLSREFLQEFADIQRVESIKIGARGGQKKTAKLEGTGERFDFSLLEAWFQPDTDSRLWAYLTRTWVRHCVPKPLDRNRSRWSPTNRWQSLQNAWGSVDMITRIAAPQIGNAEDLMGASKGNFLSAVAITSKLDALHPKGLDGKRLDITKSAATRKKIKRQAVTSARELLKKMGDYIESDQFLPELLGRRRKKGIDTFTDAEFSRLARAESMKRGKGS